MSPGPGSAARRRRFGWGGAIYGTVVLGLHLLAFEALWCTDCTSGTEAPATPLSHLWVVLPAPLVLGLASWAAARALFGPLGAQAGAVRGALAALLACVAYGLVSLLWLRGLAAWLPFGAGFPQDLGAWRTFLIGADPLTLIAAAVALGALAGGTMHAAADAGPADAAPSPPASAFAVFFAIATALVALPVAASLVAFDALPVAFATALVAAVATGAWAGLLHRPRADDRYGATRGALVAAAGYLTFFVSIWPLACYLQSDKALSVMPFVEGLAYAVASLVWTPAPWVALAAGAIVGDLRLRTIRSALRRRPR